MPNLCYTEAMKEISEKARAEAKKLRPISSIFFAKMAESSEACEEIITTVLQFPIKVLQVIPENTITNLQGRGVRLDALAEVIVVEAEILQDCPIGEKGAKVNIEVQRADDDNHQRRVRYNASVITSNETPKGTDFKDVVDVISIFISEFDVFGEGEILYEIERRIKKSGTVVFNGFSEYYVNAAVKDRTTDELSAITDLMEIFVDNNRYDYEKFPKLSERKNQLANTKEGEDIMSRDVQRIMDEAAAEKEQQTLVQSIKNLMKNLQLNIDQAMDALSIPSEQRSMYAGMVNAK